MAKSELKIAIRFDEESLREFQDGILLMQWRMGEVLNECEQERLAKLVGNFRPLGLEEAGHYNIHQSWESLV